MKAILLLTAGGPIAILTSYETPTAPGLVKKLEAKGIAKFIAYEMPLELARQRYAGHFSAVQQDVHETDDLRVLDYSGERIFSLFRFDELGPATSFEGSHFAMHHTEKEPSVEEVPEDVQ